MENSINVYAENEVLIPQLKADIVALESELRKSDLYVKLQNAKQKLEEAEQYQEQYKTNIKNSLEEQWIKKIELDKYCFTLKESAWTLSIKDESVIPEEYFDTKKTLNKTRLKNAVKEWLDLPWVKIVKSNSLIITIK